MMFSHIRYGRGKGRPGAIVAVTFAAAFLASVSGTALLAQQQSDPDTVVATVNGLEITQRDLDIAAEDPALSLQGMPEAERRNLLVSYLVDLKLGAAAAREAGVAASPGFEARLAYFTEKLLLDDLLARHVEEAVTDEAARALYDETVKSLTPEQEVRARHILVETEEQAQAVVQRLNAGEAFETVAADVSTDPGSRTRGGDLGFFTKDRMVPEFAEAAFALEPGTVSAPVKSQFGWHIIRTEERRERPIPEFETMRTQIDNYLARRAQQELILSLRQGANVERLGADGGQTPPQGAAPESAAPESAAPQGAAPEGAAPAR